MIGQKLAGLQPNSGSIHSIIQQIITAAILEDNQALALIKSRGFSLDIQNNQNFSAAFILGTQLNLKAITFLWDNIENQIDIAKGLAYQGSEFAEFYINKLPKAQRDYQAVAGWAARGGQQILAEFLLNRLPEDQRHYQSVANNAARGGQQALAEFFLNKLPEDERNYNMLAGCAARGGQQALAEFFLNKLPEDERNYNVLASCAVRDGLQELANFYLNKLPEDKRNYQFVADEAAKNGYANIAAFFRLKAISIQPSYPFLVHSATHPLSTRKRVQEAITSSSPLTPAFETATQQSSKRPAIVMPESSHCLNNFNNSYFSPFSFTHAKVPL